MILSMTGFGRKVVENEEYRCEVEARSLNHRYCDITVKLPKQLSFLEPKIRKLIQERISRGKVDISINLISSSGTSKEVVVNYPLAQEISKALKSISTRFGIREPDISPFLSELITIHNGQGEEDVWPLVERTVYEALNELMAFRASEGKALKNDLTETVDRIKNLVGKLETLAANEPNLLKKRLEERLSELEVGVDPQRLAQEVAILADRVDIKEEIVRMRSHISQWLKVMEEGSPCGRRLDFLTQEMHREASTMASKSRDAKLIAITVELRDEIGKLKEQVQNVE